MDQPVEPSPAESKPLLKRSFGKRRMRVVLILALVAIVGLAYFRQAPPSRFDPNMPEAEAVRIRDEALKADDAETWLAIQEDWFLPQTLEPIEITPRTLFKMFRSYRSISKTMRVVASSPRREQEFRHVFWQTQDESRGGALYRPRIFEAAARKCGEEWRINSNSTHLQEDYLGFAASQRLFMLFRRQGRSGESLDQRWYMAISNPSARSISSNLYQILLFGDMWVFEAGLNQDLEQAPDDPWLKRCLGIMAWKKKDFAKAEPILAEAASRFDNDPLGRFAWAESRRELGLPFDPVEIMGEKCTETVHFATQESTRLTFRAQLHQSLGRLAEARTDAEAAVAIDPRSESAWESLARVCRELGDDARAAEAGVHAERWTSVRARLASMVKSATLIAQSGTSDRTLKIELPVMHRIEELVREAEWELPTRLFEAIRNRSQEASMIDPAQFLAQNRMPSPDRYFLPRPKL